MSDKLNTLEALRLASLKAKGYTAEQIAELSSAMEDIIKDINDSLKTCEAHVQSAHAPANAEENVIVSIQRNGQAIPPDNKVVNIEVPTKTSALENDSGYATTEDVEEMVCEHLIWYAQPSLEQGRPRKSWPNTWAGPRRTSAGG